MVSKKRGKVVHGHPRCIHPKPSGGESDTPMDLKPTKRRGRATDSVNILRTNRKRNKRSNGN